MKDNNTGGNPHELYRFFSSTPRDEDFANLIDDATQELRKGLKLKCPKKHSCTSCQHWNIRYLEGCVWMEADTGEVLHFFENADQKCSGYRQKQSPPLSKEEIADIEAGEREFREGKCKVYTSVEEFLEDLQK